MRERRAGVDEERTLDNDGSWHSEPESAAMIGNAPTPEFAAIAAEECRRLLDHLGDAELQALAVAKMEGYSNNEIAAQQNCSVRTIERRLFLVRRKWERDYVP